MFDLEYSDEAALRQTLQGVTSYYAAGFHIAVIGDLRLNDWFNLRLVPGVTLVERGRIDEVLKEIEMTQSKYFDPETAAKVAEIYKKTAENRSAQLVFCDTSTPKDTFNI